jgi:hypothetical protein
MLSSSSSNNNNTDLFKSVLMCSTLVVTTNTICRATSIARKKKTNHFWWLVIWCPSCNAPSLHCMARIYQGKIATHYILQASPSTLFLLLFPWFAFSTFAMRAATSYM